MKLFKNKLSSLISHLTSHRGFTLIELLIVIAILGILAAAILVAINPVKKINQANDATMKGNVGQIATALQAYFVINQAYPAGTDETGLQVLVGANELKVLPAPPTGYTYSYSTSGSGDTAQAALSFTLKASTAVGDIWCWRSAVGRAEVIVAGTSCTP